MGTSNTALPDSLVSVFDRTRRGFLLDLANGVFPAGGVLPTIETLAHRYGASTATIQRLIAEMNEAGLVRTVRYRGSYVLREPDALDPELEKRQVRATLTLPRLTVPPASDMHQLKQDLLIRIQEEFLQTHPDVRVRMRPKGVLHDDSLLGYRDYANEIRRYSAVDFHHSSMPLLDAEGALSNLREMAEKCDLENVYRPEVWRLCWNGRRLLGLPERVINPIVLFYNREAAARNGLKDPSEDWTWDEFRAVAERMTRDAAVEQAVAVDNALMLPRLIWALLAQVDGYRQIRRARSWQVAFRKDVFLEVFQLAREAFLNFGMADSNGFYGGDRQVDGLEAGRVGFLMGDVIKRPVDPRRIGILPLPRLPGGKTVHMSFFTILGVPKSTSPAVRKAAQEFLLFRARPEWPAAFVRAGLEPLGRSVFRPEVLADQDLDASPSFVDGRQPYTFSNVPLERCRFEPLSPVIGMGVLSRIFYHEVIFRRSDFWRTEVDAVVDYFNESCGLSDSEFEALWSTPADEPGT